MLKKELAERGINSLAIIPLIVGGESLGVLALYAADTGFFDEEEMKLLGELAGDIAFALDHIQKSERLDYVAYYDVLTGLANRALFNERLTQHLRIGDREHGLALVLLDLERFKAVNDSLGRHSGDELLKQVARRLAHCAGDPGRVGRLSGDQFGVMLDCAGHPDELARGVENQMRTCFAEGFRLESGAELRVSVRGGIALAPRDGSDFETLHRNAEAALKKAKTSGERFMFYAGHMTEKAAERLTLENKLRLALDRDEFVLHYQPKVDIETRGIQGVEALIRWQSPELGLVPPMDFIPMLEETGMILEAGAWAMRRAALDHKSWIERALPAPRISVNVSAFQLRKRDFVHTVQAALAEDARTPGLDLEITESLVMEDIAENMRKLAAVRDLGVGIAVDDFGTGYSSLRYLAMLPVQTVKIDRAFIVTMLKDPSTMTLVSMIIALAHSLSLKVVAEGVDSEEQAAALRALKCDQMQGYLFSKPLPLAELQALLGSARPAAR
jgi:diguanylate cyclase (GGDEF)-like protein